MRYQIIQTTTIGEMVGWVQDNLDKGWQLYGNLVVSGGTFIQPMTKSQMASSEKKGFGTQVRLGT